MIHAPGTSQYRARQYQLQQARNQYSSKSRHDDFKPARQPLTAAQRERRNRQNQQFKQDYPCINGFIECCCGCIFHTCQWIFCFPCQIRSYCYKKEREHRKQKREKTIEEIDEIMKKPNIPPRDREILFNVRNAVSKQLEDSRYIGRRQDPKDYSKVPEVKKILMAHRNQNKQAK